MTSAWRLTSAMPRSTRSAALPEPPVSCTVCFIPSHSSLLPTRVPRCSGSKKATPIRFCTRLLSWRMATSITCICQRCSAKFDAIVGPLRPSDPCRVSVSTMRVPRPAWRSIVFDSSVTPISRAVV